MVISRNAEYAQCRLKKRIDEWCDNRTLSKDKETAKQHHDENDGKKPKLLANAQKYVELFEECH